MTTIKRSQVLFGGQLPADMVLDVAQGSGKSFYALRDDPAESVVDVKTGGRCCSVASLIDDDQDVQSRVASLKTAFLDF